MIKEICGGEISKIDIQSIESYKNKIIKFKPIKFEQITGFKISTKEMINILEKLGFKLKKEKKFLKLSVPSWRADILNLFFAELLVFNLGINILVLYRQWLIFTR